MTIDPKKMIGKGAGERVCIAAWHEQRYGQSHVILRMRCACGDTQDVLWNTLQKGGGRLGCIRCGNIAARHGLKESEAARVLEKLRRRKSCSIVK